MTVTTAPATRERVSPSRSMRIAVLIPCHNEEMTIERVVNGFRSELPSAQIYVFDNNSSDRTVEVAKAAGAIVMHEPRLGKGNVVQSMFREVDSDVYIMVDGDDTYPAEAVHRLIAPILDGTADMVIGSRMQQGNRSEFRALNRFGNWMYLFVLRGMFGRGLTDLLSGYRAFNRRFVTGTPLFGGGFETEAEMTIRAVTRRFRVQEVPVDLRSRPEGSRSKIRILRDGTVILKSMFALFRDYKPLAFFGSIGVFLVLLALAPGIWVISDFLKTGTIERLPSAILAVGLVLSGLISIVMGVILHVIAQRFRELQASLQMIADELRRGGRPPDSQS
jgi:glycosyltransferase involved in cell wall biosynthesis